MIFSLPQVQIYNVLIFLIPVMYYDFVFYKAQSSPNTAVYVNTYTHTYKHIFIKLFFNMYYMYIYSSIKTVLYK